MSKGLKLTFLFHGVVATVFGLALLLVPRLLADLASWTPFDPLMTRIAGTALLALALGSWIGFFSAGWDQVRVIVLAEVLFTVVGALAGAYELVLGHAPVAAIVPTGVLGDFAALWIIFALRDKV